MLSLSTAILKTVAYFDIFDYPLTAFEIWQYLPEATSLSDVILSLENDSLPLGKKSGFYFLPGRSETFDIRRERYLIANQKIQKTRRRLRWIQWLPSIRLICLANSIGTHNLRATSDSDLFVITKPHRLWLTKSFATSILSLLRIRPTPGHSIDRLCLSFLVSENNLNLENCRLPQDPYFTYWLTGLIPLYGDITVYQKLITANPWLSTSLPNWSLATTGPLHRFQSRTKNHFWAKNIFNQLEEYAHKLHLVFMSDTIKNMANKNQQVLVTDDILKLHTIDRREYFNTEYNRRLQSLGLSL